MEEESKMSEIFEVNEQRFRTTVYLQRQPFRTYPEVLIVEHTGPSEPKIDDKGNLRIEVYYPNSDFETVAALVLAGTFYGVTQDLIVDEDEDEDCPCEDCRDGTPKLDALLNDDNSVFIDDEEPPF